MLIRSCTTELYIYLDKPRQIYNSGIHDPMSMDFFTAAQAYNV